MKLKTRESEANVDCTGREVDGGYYVMYIGCISLV